MPNVFNLALPNETLASFYGGNANPAANTSYTSGLATQDHGVPALHGEPQLAIGHSIGTMTIALGTSDIANILNTPGFASMSLIQQATALQSGLNTIQSEYSALMTVIRNVLPNTQIDLIGAYNPYHATPNDPIAPIAEPAFLGLNKIIQGEATKFGATYVDTYTAFLGHESTYTNITGGQGNINPTPAGFGAIASQLGSTTVPEPSTLFLPEASASRVSSSRTWRRLDPVPGGLIRPDQARDRAALVPSRIGRAGSRSLA